MHKFIYVRPYFRLCRLPTPMHERHYVFSARVPCVIVFKLLLFYCFCFSFFFRFFWPSLTCHIYGVVLVQMGLCRHKNVNPLKCVHHFLKHLNFVEKSKRIKLVHDIQSIPSRTFDFRHVTRTRSVPTNEKQKKISIFHWSCCAFADGISIIACETRVVSCETRIEHFMDEMCSRAHSLCMYFCVSIFFACDFQCSLFHARASLNSNLISKLVFPKNTNRYPSLRWIGIFSQSEWDHFY